MFKSVLLLLLSLFAGTTAFSPLRRLPSIRRPETRTAASAYEGFMVKGSRKVDVFKVEKDISEGIASMFVVAACINIAQKGSFSVAIPSGSVVKALGSLAGSGKVDFSKVHVFFTNDKVGSAQPSYEGALADFIEPCGIPMKNVYQVPPNVDKSRAAAMYSNTIERSPVVENGAFDFVVLGTGADGHCASLFPGAPELEGKGVVLAKQGEDAVTFSLETINKAKKVLISAAGPGRALMVFDALVKGKESGMPAAMVSGQDTTWLVDNNSVAEYKAEYGTRESMAAV